MAAAKNAEIGAQLRKERKERGWDVHEMARQLAQVLTGPRVDHASLVSYVWRWEAGKYTVSERYRLAYAAALDRAETELFGIEEEDPGTLTAGSLRVDARDEWDDDMYRRAALQLLTALSAGATIPVGALDTVLSAVKRTLGDRDGFSLEDWEEIVWEYGQTAWTEPPGVLLADLTADFIEVGRQLDRDQPPLVRSGLLRVSAQLAAYMAMEFGDIGERRATRQSLNTARHAADASGDHDLRVWVRGWEASRAFWAGRPAPVVLRIIDDAVKTAGNTPSVGLAIALEANAKLAAVRGDENEARRAHRDLMEVFARLPHDVTTDQISPWGWPEDRLWLNEGYVYTLLGDKRATFALERALALYPPERMGSKVNLRLIQAIGLVRDHDVDEGLSDAVAATQGLPFSASRRRITGQILEALPDSKASALPAARELCALTAGPLR